MEKYELCMPPLRANPANEQRRVFVAQKFLVHRKGLRDDHPFCSVVGSDRDRPD